jgi:hypothetical protein
MDVSQDLTSLSITATVQTASGATVGVSTTVGG